MITIETITTLIIAIAPALASVIAAIVNFVKNNKIVSDATAATGKVIEEKFTCTDAALHELANSVNELSAENKALRDQQAQVLAENAKLKALLVDLLSEKDHVAYTEEQIMGE